MPCDGGNEVAHKKYPPLIIFFNEITFGVEGTDVHVATAVGRFSCPR